MSDDKLELSRRKILGATGAVGAAGAAAGLGTSALFSDQESFSNNLVQAGTTNLRGEAEIVAVSSGLADNGTVELTDANNDDGSDPDVLEADGTLVAGLTVQDMKPGDSFIVRITAEVEDNPMYVAAVAANADDSENRPNTEPENSTEADGIDPDVEDGTGAGNGSDAVGNGSGDDAGDLDNELLVTFGYDGTQVGGTVDRTLDDTDGSGNPKITPDPGVGFDGSSSATLTSFLDALQDAGLTYSGQASGTADPPGGHGDSSSPTRIGGNSGDANVDREQVTHFIRFELPIGVGNEVQGDSVSFDLGFDAEQARNNNDPFPGSVFNSRTGNRFSEVQAAVNAAQPGDTIRAQEAASFDESVEVDVENLTLEAISNTKPVIKEGVDIRANGVTVDGFEIQNPGTQGSADSGSPAGRVGVHVNSGNEDASILNNDITEVGTGDDDANPIGVLASDGTSGVTVENNNISNLEGTDEDQGQVQGVLINESGTQITGATVNNNTITGLLDTRSTNAIRFNGDVKGEIIGNTISDLNTEGDIPGTNDPGGFTQVIALQQGGGSTTGPSDVTIQGNNISNIETTTPGNFAPPVHLILGSSASNVTVGGTSPSEANSFSADSPDVEIFVLDGSGTLNLSSVQSNNSLAPSAQIGPAGARIFPGNLTLVTAGDDLQTEIDNANPGDTLAVDSGTFDAVTIDKSLSLKSIFARPTVEADSSTGRLEVAAPDVEMSGFDIDLSDGEVVYGKSSDGLIFRNNDVEISGSSNYGLRLENPNNALVSDNEFNHNDIPSSVSGTPQGVLLSDGSQVVVRNNVLNGPSNGSPQGQGILVSENDGGASNVDIVDNDIDSWDQGVFLFENNGADIAQVSIVGNEITNSNDDDIVALDNTGTDGFEAINGKDTESNQETALEADNDPTGVSANVRGI